MGGFWKTGKELSDQAEISRISSWAVGDLNLWISARSDNVKRGGWGGGGLEGRNFRGVKIFLRNFHGHLLGEFRIEWVFVHPDPMSDVTCRRLGKKSKWILSGYAWFLENREGVIRSSWNFADKLLGPRGP